MTKHLLGTAAALALLVGGAALAQDQQDPAKISEPQSEAEADGSGAADDAPPASGTDAAMTVAPRVMIEECAPTVSVTQTPPRVMITLPDDIAAGAAPQVGVSQAPPEVTVESCQPTVRVMLDGEEVQPDIEFTASDAVVTIHAAETAELAVSRAEDLAEDVDAAPVAEAQAGQDSDAPAPEGDPDARDDNPAVPEPADAAPETGASGEASAEAEAPSAQGAPVAAGSEGQDVPDEQIAQAARQIALREGQQLVEADEVVETGLDGLKVFSADELELGEIDQFDTEGRMAIIGLGGFLGMGERDVALPLDQISFQRDGNGEIRAYLAVAADDVDSLPDHQPAE